MDNNNLWLAFILFTSSIEAEITIFSWKIFLLDFKNTSFSILNICDEVSCSSKVLNTLNAFIQATKCNVF